MDYEETTNVKTNVKTKVFLADLTHTGNGIIALICRQVAKTFGPSWRGVPTGQSEINAVLRNG
jgi:hypothetical protein